MLTQGKSTVTEYALKFDRLVKFTFDVIPTDKSRRDKFLRGLRAMINRDVIISIDK